jgi:aspartate carbamoyltransferase catalytic subunit
LVLPDADVLYVTRVQRERMDEPVDCAYAVTEAEMKLAKSTMALLHPLPRVGEISTAVDNDPRAAYFRQMRYGLFMRMGILTKVLETPRVL